LGGAASAHTMAVAEGIGWGVTTPMCLLQSAHHLDKLQIHPLSRGQFYRHFDLLARENSMGDVPQKLAEEATRIIKNEIMPDLWESYPWLKPMFKWSSDEAHSYDGER